MWWGHKWRHNIAHTICMLDTQGYMHARSCKRTRARANARTRTHTNLQYLLPFHGNSVSQTSHNFWLCVHCVSLFLTEHDGLFSEASATRQTVHCCIFWAQRLVATMTMICVGKCHNHSTYRNFESISGMYKVNMPMLWETQLMQHNA